MKIGQLLSQSVCLPQLTVRGILPASLSTCWPPEGNRDSTSWAEVFWPESCFPWRWRFTNMHLTKLTVAIGLLGSILTAEAAIGKAQAVEKQVNATIPYSVVVADKALEPGKYTLRETANHVIQVFEGDKMIAKAAVITIDTEDKQPAKETKLVLYRFGGNGNNYYLDKMWIQGRATGYEFPLPERLKSLKHEREESLAGTYEESHEQKEGLK
jgi:hypothetical protein